MRTISRVTAITSRTSNDFVLSVRDLRKHFPIKEGVFQRVTGHVHAVDGVSFDIRRGETVGLVGESGCGKTTLGRCVSGLLSSTDGGVYFGLDASSHAEIDALLAVTPADRTPQQQARLRDLDRMYRIDVMSRDRWRDYRRNCQVVFQDAFSSLNPRQLIKDIIARPLRVYREASGDELNARVIELLESVGLGEQHLYRYPHQFSGGQRQRISIARALALDPDFVVLDEPTSALDVSVQAQILNLLHRLQKERGLTYLFITHDLNVVRHMSDRIVVMYLGQVCEVGPSQQVFAHPRHPYTEALIAADPSGSAARDDLRLMGPIPDPARPPQGCRFHTRCPVATRWCGWEIDDVVRQLEDRGLTLDDLTGVQRQSEFEAELVFASEEAAGLLLERLSPPTIPDVMAGATIEARRDGSTVRVAFHPVDEVRLLQIEPDHATACILHNGQHPER